MNERCASPSNREILASVLFAVLLSIGCARSGVRSDAGTERRIAFESPPSYKYEADYNCPVQGGNASESEAAPRWSPLTGMLVGPSTRKLHPRADDKILRPFKSDGCSLSPDGIPGTSESEAWAECCVTHDAAYWTGGTEGQRERADDEMKQCLSRKGYDDIGKLYRMFIRQFGGPESSQTFRWGYGWNYRRSAGPLKDEEKSQAQRLAEIMKTDLSATGQQVLKRSCDTYDVALLGYNNDDRQIYKALNAKLKEDQRIEWMKLSYFNLKKTVYEFQLTGCAAPFVVSIVKSKPPAISAGCPELLIVNGR